jgi:hypothetical protein
MARLVTSRVVALWSIGLARLMLNQRQSWEDHKDVVWSVNCLFFWFCLIKFKWLCKSLDCSFAGSVYCECSVAVPLQMIWTLSRRCDVWTTYQTDERILIIIDFIDFIDFELTSNRFIIYNNVLLMICY